MSSKALLMDVKRFAVHDGPGIRTTLFLKGCPLKCIWCHNPEGIQAKFQMAYYSHKCILCGECVRSCPTGAQKILDQGKHVFIRGLCIACGSCIDVCLGEAMHRYGQSVELDEAVRIALEDVDFYGNTGGVTVSGGEPLLQPDFVAKFLKTMKDYGIHTAVDTCGCIPWDNIEKVLPYADMFLYDIKHLDTQRHRELTGRGNEQILTNITRLSEHGACIEVRFPLVPGCNDDETHIDQLGMFLSKLNVERVKVLPYHSMARAKYEALGMKDTMPRVDSPTTFKLQSVVAHLQQLGVNAYAD